MVESVRSSDITSCVTTTSGNFQASPRHVSGVIEFLGMPFAAPPVGSLRWKPPQPVSKPSFTQNATSFGPSCYSFEANDPSSGIVAPPAGPQSEDCLSINVWTASESTAEKRPVMVWLYGGGFQFGSSSSPNYNGTHFATDGVVFVSFNYRTGTLGFLALQELDDEGTNSGNFGLQDQIAALQWVKLNIAAFGGDPDNVTIFGESAGAHAVGLLLASPLSSGLFHKAILESGAYWESEHGSITTFQQARQHGSAFLQSQANGSLTKLRSLSATLIVQAGAWNASTDPGITAFSPSIDNYVVPVAPSVAFDKGRTHKVPIIAGFNQDEGALFFSRALPHSTPTDFQSAQRIFFAGTTGTAFSLYPSTSENQTIASADALIGDLVIAQQTWEALDRQAASSGQACYGYHFTYTSPYSPVSIHTSEIPFVFGNLGPNPLYGGSTPAASANDVARSKSMTTYWINFAKTGNPNRANLSAWPKYAASGNNFLELGVASTAVQTPSSGRFQYIRSLRNNGILPLRWRSEFVDN